MQMQVIVCLMCESANRVLWLLMILFKFHLKGKISENKSQKKNYITVITMSSKPLDVGGFKPAVPFLERMVGHF